MSLARSRPALLAALVIVVLAGSALFGASPAAGAPGPTHWCGTDEVAADRTPDAVAGYQLHVVYAIPSDGTDRFSQFALPIARDLASIDSWWTANDPTRTPRWDLAAFTGCDTTFGALDISVDRLSQSGGTFVSMTSAATAALQAALSAQYSSPYKKYLVYYDGPVDPAAGICGFSPVGPNTSGGADFSVVLMQSVPGRCGTPGAGDYMAVTAVHELLHNLGAVPVGAPHRCPDSAHICSESPTDIMNTFGTSNSLFSYVLDAGHDDYYGHSGTWWDVQDSPFLAHLNAPSFALGVTVTGSGTVASDSPGISCPAACSINWDSGTQVTLTASPSGGSHFSSWTGACTGSVSPCTVTMDAAKSVTAEFAVDKTSTKPGKTTSRASVRVSVVLKGSGGTVTSRPRGLRCSATSCTGTFDPSSPVLLTAVPGAGSRFAGWGGACFGRTKTCSLRLAGPVVVTSVFAPLPLCAKGRKSTPAHPCRR
jgi:hypothetical protein